MKALFDTNILIDYLNGIEAAREEIAHYATVLISPITWMEVMAGTNAADQTIVRRFLSRFTLVPVDSLVAEAAVAIRRSRRIKLPDAIIWASAQVAEALLVSRNTRDFPANTAGIRVPYKL